MQLSMWSPPDIEPAIACGFRELRRIELDPQSWLEVVPGFVCGHDTLFARLERGMRWKQERRVMYERELDVPRLIASAPADGPLDPLLAEVASLLAQRYCARFERVGLAHYRDGRDSVAWHRDRLPRGTATLVAILSLGTPRKLLVRPFGGGASRSFALGAGDLFVMGGLSQTHWEHCVPKQKHAAPRISCMFRHVY